MSARVAVLLIVSWSLLAPGLFAQGVTSCLFGPLTASDGDPFENFGHALAATDDLLVVGAWGDDDLGPDSGSAYVFRRIGTAWIEEAKLLASDGTTNDLFGADVAISGDVLVVSGYAGVSLGSFRGAAYVFRHDGATWQEEAILAPLVPTLDDLYGWSVAIDGDRILVSDPRNTFGSADPGRVYVYDYSGTHWDHSATLTASAGIDNDRFGWSLALQGDRALIGAPATMASGVTEAGAAYVFEFDGSTWSESALPGGSRFAHRRFGESVAWAAGHAVVAAIEFDGSSGAVGTGTVHFFDDSSGTWLETSSWQPTNPTDLRFGERLASDATSVVARGRIPGGAGFAEANRFEAGAWTPGERIVQPSGTAADRFGEDVALAGNRLLAGAPGNDLVAADAGSVWDFGFSVVLLPFVRGDANSDGGVDLGDAIWLLSYVFQDGAAPPCSKAGDANGDQVLDVGDAIFLISYIFSDGTSPSAPFPACGTETAPSSVCCLASPSCP